MKTIGKKILTTFIILILAMKSTGFSQNIAAYASSDEQSDISGSASTSTEGSVSVTADPAGSVGRIKTMITELEDSVTNVKQQQIEDKTVIRSDHKLILPEEADYSLYIHVIENLEEKYGSLRIKEETDSENVRRRMANGLWRKKQIR